jgi:hypothetical protein
VNDAAERAAGASWCGPRRSPRLILGEGLGASLGWQCVHALSPTAPAPDAPDAPAVRPRIALSGIGTNQQACGVILPALP